jgi:hypothetical protein
MGQRHQVFIRVKNPIKMKYASYLKPDEIKRAKAMFGSGETTILVFHHQWLYGRSPIVKIQEIFEVTEPDEIAEYSNPFGGSYQFDTLDEYIKAVTTMISLSFSRLSPRGIGLERYHFLNEDEPYMREFYDRGDNNDGISIIDTIERKYCLMNIHSSVDKEDNSIYRFDPYTPISGADYVNAYYPKGGKRENAKVCKGLTKFGLLNHKELKKLFPKIEKYLVG